MTEYKGISIFPRLRGPGIADDSALELLHKDILQMIKVKPVSGIDIDEGDVFIDFRDDDAIVIRGDIQIERGRFDLLQKILRRIGVAHMPHGCDLRSGLGISRQSMGRP